MTTLIAHKLLQYLSEGEVLVLNQAELTFGREQEVIATGSIEVSTEDKLGLSYKMRATNFNLSATNRANELIKENSYYTPLWPRIDGTHGEGRSWSITQLKPVYDIQDDTEEPTILVIGSTHSINGFQETARFSTSRHEAIFDLSQYYNTANSIGYMVGNLKTIEVNGTTIWFHFDFDTNKLHITAIYSETCPQPFLDSWIFEPLQVLFGVPLEPVIAIRVPNNKNWKTQLHVKPCPNIGEELNTGLWTFARSRTDKNTFWNWYVRLFEYFSSHSEDEGSMSFDCLSLTRYFYELQIASQKTIWLRSLAYAATIEGLAKHLLPEETYELSQDETLAIKDIKKHLKKYKREGISEGQKKIDSRLIGRLYESLAYLTKLSARNRLLKLVELGVLRSEHEQSWSTVRNPIMHGALGTQWSTEKGDFDTRIMMEAVARMTCELVGIKKPSLKNFD